MQQIGACVTDDLADAIDEHAEARCNDLERQLAEVRVYEDRVEELVTHVPEERSLREWRSQAETLTWLKWWAVGMPGRDDKTANRSSVEAERNVTVVPVEVVDRRFHARQPNVIAVAASVGFDWRATVRHHFVDHLLPAPTFVSWEVVGDDGVDLLLVAANDLIPEHLPHNTISGVLLLHFLALSCTGYTHLHLSRKDHKHVVQTQQLCVVGNIIVVGMDLENGSDTEAFADETPLVVLLGQPARVKIISVLVDERQQDLSISEIARQAGIARSTVYDHLDELVTLGVAEFTRESGASQRYQLADTEIAQRLYELDGLVLQRLLEGVE